MLAELERRVATTSSTRTGRALYALASLAAVVGLAAGAAPVAGQASQTGPAIEIEPAVWDFGGVSQDQRLQHAFTIENVGTEVLEIRRISTSCGCAAAVPDTSVIEPGQTTRLVVTLETRRYKGVIEKSISVASNDPKRVRTVRVQAFVEVPEP